MFSVLSWNVEHFKGGPVRVNDVVQHIKDQDPDIFGIFEVEGADVMNLVRDHFPSYDFNITDGPQQMEMIVAHRQGKFDQVAFTQKREFKVFNPALRPGAMLSVRTENTLTNILFLHVDSGTEAPDFGNRQEMFEKIAKVKNRLDILSGAADGRLIVLGDLNTMGLFFPSRRVANRRITAEEEIAALNAAGDEFGMSLLVKNEENTFNNGTLKSNLDHVLASDSLQFVQQGSTAAGDPAFVNVRGWINLVGEERKRFINEISDHCSMFMEVK